MSYQVLARKWRPGAFQDVVGQAHAVKALSNALNQNRLHHAYLFTGTRGVGKTSIARILAKCLNCAQGVSAIACNACDSCLAINAGNSLDLIEVDAASRTKVEDTRELLSNTQYAPSHGRYKIYLIDEVHMLSGHSFNALLKTLEEPPPHIKFLLATTDPQKLPATILSRCLQFHLKQMPAQDIALHLATILVKEAIPYEEAALRSLAEAADGSMRDALSLLDQAIAYGNNQVTTQDVMTLLGNTPQSMLVDIVYQLSQHNPQKLLDNINALAEQSTHFTRTLEGLLALLHQIAVLQALPNRRINDYWQEADAIVQLAQIISPEQLQLYYQIALIGRRDLPLASTPKQGLEMVLLRMLAFNPSTTIPSVTTMSPMEKRSNTLELKKENNPENTATLPVTMAKKISDVATTSTEPAFNKLPEPLLTNDLQNSWPLILPQLKLSGMTQSLAMQCALQDISEDSIQLSLALKHAPLLTPTQKGRLHQALNQYFNKTRQLEIKLVDSTQNTPAQLIEHTTQAQQFAAKKKLNEDNTLQEFIEEFDATLIPSSIQVLIKP